MAFSPFDGHTITLRLLSRVLTNTDEPFIKLEKFVVNIKVSFCISASIK